MKRIYLYAADIVMCFLLATCATIPENQTGKTLDSFVGKNITDFIAKIHAYPDSDDPLPGGGHVYRFSTGSGASVDNFGNIRSRVCKYWIETKADGVIYTWRAENCS